jgi:hypothetical protein
MAMHRSEISDRKAIQYHLDDPCPTAQNVVTIYRTQFFRTLQESRRVYCITWLLHN